MQNIKRVLKDQLDTISLDKKTLSHIKKVSKDFIDNLKKELRKNKIKAEPFIGGSLAKKTLIKKDKYDIDIFIRFDKKYRGKGISELLAGVLPKKAKKIHGSRDYYSFIVERVILEIVPVLEIEEPEQAQNITDLSYFHVDYILEKIRKNRGLDDEIKLAKDFAYAQNCYGAESYVHGFSGYSLELLVAHYGSFMKFIKAMANNKVKIIIDDERFYSGKSDILMGLNESKLQSPMILIDPTYKERNALAGLNNETFEKFKQACKRFLENPGGDLFIRKNILKELEKRHKKVHILNIKTTKQQGDIAGTKSKKFFDFFVARLKKEFRVKRAEFDYIENKNIANYYFVIGDKKEEIVKGPKTSDKENIKRFKKSHPKTFVKKDSIYTNISHTLSFGEFIQLDRKSVV